MGSKGFPNDFQGKWQKCVENLAQITDLTSIRWEEGDEKKEKKNQTRKLDVKLVQANEYTKWHSIFVVCKFVHLQHWKRLASVDRLTSFHQSNVQRWFGLKIWKSLRNNWNQKHLRGFCFNCSSSFCFYTFFLSSWFLCVFDTGCDYVCWDAMEKNNIYAGISLKIRISF